MTFLRVVIASVLSAIIASAVAAWVTQFAVARGWAYQLEPTEARGWMGRTVGRAPRADKSGISAGAVAITTMFLTVVVCMTAFSALLGI